MSRSSTALMLARLYEFSGEDHVPERVSEELDFLLDALEQELRLPNRTAVAKFGEVFSAAGDAKVKLAVDDDMVCFVDRKKGTRVTPYRTLARVTAKTLLQDIKRIKWRNA